MTNTQNQNLSAVEQSLNWIGDKLLDARNYFEVDLGTQKFINGMNLTENYKVIYEKQNNDLSSEWSIKLASEAGAIVQAYTGPTLYYTVGKFTEGLSNVFGDSIAKGMDIFIGTDFDGSLLGAYARIGEVAGNSTASGLIKVLKWSDDNFGQYFRENDIKNEYDVFLSTPFDNISKSLTISKTTNSNKETIKVSSSDYSKEELTNSSKSNIQSQNSGTKITIEGSDGVLNTTLLDNSLLEEANKLLKTNLDFNSNLKIDISDDKFLVEDNKNLTMQDGTTSTLGSILNTLKSASEAIPAFLLGSADFGAELIESAKAIFNNEKPDIVDEYGNPVLDEDGNIVKGPSELDYMIGEFVARVINGESAQDASIDIAGRKVAEKIGENLAAQIGGSQSVQAGVAVVIAKLGLAQLNGEDQNSDDYALVATQAILAYFGISPAITAAIINSSKKILEEDGKFNSDGYQDVAAIAVTSFVVAVICINIGAAVGTAIGGPVGTAVGVVVGALVGYLIAEPFYNMLRNGWEDIEQIYDALEDIFKGDDIDDQLKEALKGIDDLGRTLSIDLIKDIGRGAIRLFTGGYGKEYKPGEYPDPYSYLQIIAKEDGTGNKIIGIEKEGVVAIAREYYHDDIYGTSGSDNLVGKSGTNTIYGYAGDDHIEGRGDIDLLVGGDGNDEIYAGNGDDKVYGGNGDDSLFGGNGNDQIVGGTGNDFILGGNGDDQIMGEEGDDTIYGNAGNDTILGGAGNDRIEGNEGDDSILGEEGDDIILAGDGSDVIDGGAGDDYIEGGEGNDNIRGGDGDDEILGQEGVDIIYGDAGNDVVNSGDDNDLVFGGLGNDIIYGGNGENSLYGELGNDFVIGGDENDIINGGDGDDVLLGGAGDDTITTGLGNDTIIFRSGDGSDTIDETDTIDNFGISEVGNDVIRFAEISSTTNLGSDRLALSKVDNDLVIELKDDEGNLTGDKLTVKNQLFEDGEIVKTLEFADGYKVDLRNLIINEDNTISYSLETYSNIDTAIQEELALGYNDQMQYLDEKENPDSTHNLSNYNTSGEQEEIDAEKYNEMQWRSYKKKRSAFGGHYTVWVKYYEKNLGGTSANDRIVGHWWNENIYGGNGDDQLHGGAGNDNLIGGEGNDILHGGANNDNIYGGNGEDLIYGGVGDDNLFGENDNDTIYGNAGNDAINGGLGDDYIEGNEGDDEITDLDGNNIIIAGIGSDTINTGAGNDKIEGNDDSDIITSLGGNNLIYGNGGNDSITTGAGNDTIYGQEGFDLIYAGAGDDYISGGAGNDVIYGEDGADTIYGDIGTDQIWAGSENDYVYGGSGADVIYGEDGNDMIKAGGDDDFVEGGTGNDTIYGESGSDKIYGNDGNDTIYGGLGGDVIDGNDGDDVLFGGQGNDILIDGAGSDVLDGGEGSDIIILTKEHEESESIDVIKNFNATDDKIILKVDYKNPISFANILANLSQNSANAEISLDNGQKVIIENVNVSDITSSNFQIGLSGGENNDILFGTEGEDIIFGEEGDDEIYGGEGNDELWGGRGSDELYGEGGDDVLRYEADGKYVDDLILTNVGFSESSLVDIFSSNFFGISGDNGFNEYLQQKVWKGQTLGYYMKFDFSSDSLVRNYYIGDDISFKHSDNLENSYRWAQSGIHGLLGGDAGNYYSNNNFGYTYGAIRENLNYGYKQYFIKNFYNDEQINIDGYNRTFDKFDGGEGFDTILMTEGNDVLSLDDPTSAIGLSEAGTSEEARVKDIAVIHAGAGDDVINFSTQKYSYDDVVVYGGEGDDKIWLNEGNDKVFGGEGNDEIYTGAGDDEISGGEGDDVIYGGDGNDIIDGGSGTNQLSGEEGDDIFIAGSGVDIIDGGNGFDTISYANSSEAININLSNNEISGGDAENDTITSIENVIGSNFDDEIIGNSESNILNGKIGNDILQGGLGSDIYVYNANSGTDIITEISDDVDYLEFDSSISQSDLTFSQNGNDLEIQVGDDVTNKIILKNQYDSENRIEILRFSDEENIISLSNFDENQNNQEIAISKEFYIGNEDEELVLENINQITQINEETGEEETRWPNISALYGMVIFNETTNEYKYLSNENFFGIDELTIENEVGTEKRTIFINNVNDTPFGGIDDFEIKVEEEFSINLDDYFDDVDSEKLTYQISLKGFGTLPDWINFDEQTNILSGKSGRDGKLSFLVKATDDKGAFFEDNFKVTITRNILEDMVPTVDVLQIVGSEESDIIESIENSADIIVAGAGDDVINFKADNFWQEYENFIYNAWNVYSGDEFSVAGKVRSYDAFDGGEGYDILNLTGESDVLFLDDAIVSNLGEIAKISGIEEINAGNGDDLIDLTSLTFSYGDIIINGGAGNDILWSSDGDDILNGEDGDDNLQSGLGDDILNGGNGDDILKGYDGDDLISGGNGADTIVGGAGNDQFIYENITDSTIDNSDIILDFMQNEDIIKFENLGFDSVNKLGEEAVSGNNLEYYFDSGNTIIRDQNSNFAITLVGEIELNGSDFGF